MLLADSQATFRARLESERRWEGRAETPDEPEATAAAAAADLTAPREVAAMDSIGAALAAEALAALPADALIAR